MSQGKESGGVDETHSGSVVDDEGKVVFGHFCVRLRICRTR